MRICAFCGETCDSQIGFYDEPKKVFWGGKHHGSTVYEQKKVYFFCSDAHRNNFLATRESGYFEIQTDRWGNDGEE